MIATNARTLLACWGGRNNYPTMSYSEKPLGGWMSSLTSAASRRVRHNRLAQERIDGGRESLTAYDLRLHGARYRLAARVEQRGVALDLGCGSGYGGEILSRSDVRLVGLDRNASTPRGSRSSPYVGIIRGEGLHLPFQNGAFTTVVMLEVIEHLD